MRGMRKSLQVSKLRLWFPHTRLMTRASASASSARSAQSGARTTLITGATEGLGFHAAQQLACLGHTVLVHGRTSEKVAKVVNSLEASDGREHVGYVADLSCMEEVRRLGAEVRAEHPALDGLLNNAGSFDGNYTGQRVVTAEGNEYGLAVNVLAPFLLTSLLMPSLRASAKGARIVISSSVSMGAADALDDLQLEKSYSAHRAYSLSKLCDAMLSQELHTRYGDPPAMTFNCMDPTEEIGLGADTKMLRAGWGSWGTSAGEAKISAHMMDAPEWAMRSGEGFQSSREVSNAARRKKLWDDCVRLTGASWP